MKVWIIFELIDNVPWLSSAEQREALGLPIDAPIPDLPGYVRGVFLDEHSARAQAAKGGDLVIEWEVTK